MRNVVDVVIPVYAPDEKLSKLLAMLEKQTIKPGRVIIMYTKRDEHDSCPESGALIEAHELSKGEFDHGGTRNKGAGCSKAEYILFMTQDAVPADEALIEKLLLGFEEEKTAVCYARQLPDRSASYAERFSREFNYPDEDLLKSKADIGTMGIKAFFCSNVCAMYKKEIFDSLNGFVSPTVFNEDMIFARKALDNGYYIKYKAEAKVFHSHNFTNLEQLKRNFLLARSQKAHPEVFSDVSSESEGVRYVKKAYSYFKTHDKSYLIVPFIVTCAFRYIGYKAGKL